MKTTQRAALAAAALAIAIAGPAAAQAGGQAGQSRQAVPAGAGTLWAWGGNFYGQLGDGTTADRALPVTVKIPGGAAVTAVSAGGRHSLALTSTGRVLAWGSNLKGELGDGSTQPSLLPVPVKIPAGVTITAVQAGCHDSMALTSTGRVLAWGRNSFGELGDQTNANRELPVYVHLPAGTTVTAISAGCYYNLALTTTGKVLAWGLNNAGQLGNHDGASRNFPIRVRLPRSVKISAISAGATAAAAVTPGGQVWTWGGLPANIAMPPTSQAGTVTAVAAGSGYDLALTSRGVVLAWGANDRGQLGDGNTTSTIEPVRVRIPFNVRVTAITVASGNGFALTRNGYVLAWGFSEALGDGGGPDTDIPVRAELPPSRTVTALAGGSASRTGFAILR